MSKIQLTDTPKTIAVKMCDGNPGALHVIMECFTKGAEIDPDGAFGGLSAVMSMDTLKLYGPSIWMLYKDVCGQDIHDMIAVLRAWKLGFLPELKLRQAIDGRCQIDVAVLVAKVEKELPNFQRKEKAA